jgi:hypothetical protein
MPDKDTASKVANQSVQADNGVDYAYRRLGGTGSGAPPLLMQQHLRSNLDNWDPLLVDTSPSTPGASG